MTTISALLDYVAACGVMGLGIAIDVMVATISRFQHFPDARSGREWVARITATHIVFPMIGYYLFVVLYRLSAALHVTLGVIASLLVAVFLFAEYRDWLRRPEPSEVSDQRDKKSLSGWLAVLIVSWDALLSGPAKSAQAIGWTPWEVFFSFLFAGAVVGMLGYAAVLFAVMLNVRSKRGHLDLRRLAQRAVWARWVEFSVIAYFGILSLVRYVVQVEVPWFYILLASAGASAIPFVVQRKQLVDTHVLNVETTANRVLN